MYPLLRHMMYRVVSIPIELDMERSLTEKDGAWEKFRTESGDRAVITVACGEREQFCGAELFSLSKNGGYLLKNGTDLLTVDADWSAGTIIQVEHEESMDVFLLQMFYAQAVQRKMLLLHSSLVEWKHKGILFLGPSGIGKTTQAELWSEYRGAQIINGDAVVVQETPDAFLGWGTPWHGSSPYCENTSVPVEALVILKQARENTIRELTGFEKVTAVSNNIFYPRWLEGGMELCLETLDHLLCRVPVYELSCRPDEEAVRLTEQVVFHAG